MELEIHEIEVHKEKKNLNFEFTYRSNTNNNNGGAADQTPGLFPPNSNNTPVEKTDQHFPSLATLAVTPPANEMLNPSWAAARRTTPWTAPAEDNFPSLESQIRVTATTPSPVTAQKNKQKNPPQPLVNAWNTNSSSLLTTDHSVNRMKNSTNSINNNGTKEEFPSLGVGKSNNNNNIKSSENSSNSPNTSTKNNGAQKPPVASVWGSSVPPASVSPPPPPQPGDVLFSNSMRRKY